MSDSSKRKSSGKDGAEKRKRKILLSDIESCVCPNIASTDNAYLFHRLCLLSIVSPSIGWILDNYFDDCPSFHLIHSTQDSAIATKTTAEHDSCPHII